MMIGQPSFYVLIDQSDEMRDFIDLQVQRPNSSGQRNQKQANAIAPRESTTMTMIAAIIRWQLFLSQHGTGVLQHSTSGD